MRSLLKIAMSFLMVVCLFSNSGYIVNAQSGTNVNVPGTPNGMVYAENTNFCIDGQPFYYAGANSYDLFTLGDGYIGYTQVEQIENNFMDKDAIDTRMANMQQDGIKVVRTWGFSHEQWHGFEPEKGAYNESEFMEFDYILDSARRHNIKIIITLENYWDAYGGIDSRLAWEGLPGGTHENRAAFFTNVGCKQSYKNYVEHFVTRINHYTNIAYSDDPTIFAWELMNEPRYQNAGENSTGLTLRAWVDEMGAFIKSLDSNHMVSAGIEGHQSKYGFGGDEGNPFVYIHQSPYIDFCTAHPYPDEPWAGLSVMQAGDLVEDWILDAHNVVGKPFVLEEFNTFSLKAEYWAEMYEAIERLNAAGDNFWNYDDASAFGVNHGDQILNTVFKKHAEAMAAKCGTIPTPVNQPPFASDDTDTTNKNTAVTTDVLANDTDSDGTIDATTLTITQQPLNGTAAIVNNKIVYTPNADYFGTDSYKYTVCDNDAEVSNIAEVIITVNDSITPPPANVTFVFSTTNDWGTGFNGKFTITNNGDTAITNWQIAFDWDKSITNLYTSQLVSHLGDSYVISGFEWNNTINPGDTLELGFQGETGNVTNAPTNVVITGDNFSCIINN